MISMADLTSIWPRISKQLKSTENWLVWPSVIQTLIGKSKPTRNHYISIYWRLSWLCLFLTSAQITWLTVVSGLLPWGRGSPVSRQTRRGPGCLLGRSRPGPQVSPATGRPGGGRHEVSAERWVFLTSSKSIIYIKIPLLILVLDVFFLFLRTSLLVKGRDKPLSTMYSYQRRITISWKNSPMSS